MRLRLSQCCFSSQATNKDDQLPRESVEDGRKALGAAAEGRVRDAGAREVRACPVRAPGGVVQGLRARVGIAIELLDPCIEELRIHRAGRTKTGDVRDGRERGIEGAEDVEI